MQTAKAQNGVRVAALCETFFVSKFEKAEVPCLNLGETETEMAGNLYRLLREAEKICDILIVVEPRKKDGVMEGVLNRLRKACASVDIEH